MKKFFIILFCALFLSATGASAQTPADSGFANNLNAGTVNQYIFINCDTEECNMIIQQIADRVQPGASVYVGGHAAVVQEEPVDPAPEEQPSTPTAAVETPFQAIRISEIVSAPISGGSEWVEVYNPGIEAIDLTDWSLLEGSDRSTKLFGIIQPKNYLMFDKSSLNNSGDIVILKDSAGKIIDQITYGDWDDGNVSDNAPAPESSESLILRNDEYLVTESPTPALANALFVTAPVEEQTPVAPVETTEPAPVQEEPIEPSIIAEPTANECASTISVRVNEFLPDPVGEDTAEWIELYNDADAAVDVGGWTIDDLETGGSAAYQIPDGTVIPAKGFLVLEKAMTKISLNNTSDSVVLKDKTGVIISKFDYTSSEEGKSWAYIEGEWLLTGTISPGEPNIRDSLQTAGVADSEKKTEKVLSVTAEEARALAVNTKVKVIGQVAALPGSFSSKSMYLNGLQVYMSKGEWPDLAIGDKTEIIGKISIANGEKRVLVSEKEDIAVLAEETIEPKTIDSAQLNEKLSGYLVSAEGELVLKEGSVLTLNDAQGEFGILIKQGADIETKLFQPGEILRVAGIVAKKEEKYVIMPRSPEDIQNKTLDQMPMLGASAVSAVLPKSKSKSRALWIIGGLASVIASVKAWLFLRKRRKNYLAEIDRMRQTLVAKFS